MGFNSAFKGLSSCYTKYGHFFNVHESVHYKDILIYIQHDATLHILLYLETALHVSGGTSTGAQTIVSTASGICHTVTAICRFHGSVGTGLSMLWVAYFTHITDAVDSFLRT
jgi:hypothetical protein